MVRWPCRAIAPHVETLGTEYAGRVKVAKINVDNNQQLAVTYGIEGIPAILVFKDGQVINQLNGMPGNHLVPSETSPKPRSKASCPMARGVATSTVELTTCRRRSLNWIFECVGCIS